MSSLPRSIQWMLDLGLINAITNASNNDTNTYINIIDRENEKEIASHRQRYESLFAKHNKNSSAIEIIHDSHQNSTQSPLHARANTNNDVKKTDVTASPGPIDDPLSVFAQIEEQKVKSEKEKELEIKKERALASRKHHHHESLDRTTQQQDRQQHQNEDVNVGQRWNEFYSSREIMDIIHKDVDRLPIDHQVAAFHTKTHNNDSDVDFNLDSKIEQMKEKLDVNNSHDSIMKKCRLGRSLTISQILFVYAKEYPTVGYKQGMHEILSLVYLCLEIDMLSEKSTTLFLDSSKIANDSFIIFEAIMMLLSPAFEVRSIENNTQASSSPMELIGAASIEKIRTLARDEELFQFVSSLTVPPELYCTRWIRLMFSREVKGLSNVMELWDSFFRLVSSWKAKPSEGKMNTLMNILETTAASMIMMVRNDLIPPILRHHGHHFSAGQEDDEKDPSDCIHLMMNYPPIEDVTKLIELTEEMIYGKFNVASFATSTEIGMNDESMSVSNEYTNLPENQILPNHGQQYITPEMNHNVDMYGFQPHPVYAEDFHGNKRFNQPIHDARFNNDYNMGPAFAQNNVHNNTYTPTQLSNDSIRSTIQNITKKDTWKKLSGGLSGGLNAMKDALGSIDQTINLKDASGSIVEQTMNFLSTNVDNATPQQSSNATNPDYSNFHNMNYDHTNLNYRPEHLSNEYQSIGQEYNFNAYYRNEKVTPLQNTGVVSIPQQYDANGNQQNASIVEQSLYQGARSQQHPLQNETPPSQSDDNSNVVEIMEDDFVGARKTQISNNDNLSQHVADRLNSSLSHMRLYLQSCMKNGQQIPPNVWDALTEIEGIKNDLTTIYKITEKDH